MGKAGGAHRVVSTGHPATHMIDTTPRRIHPNPRPWLEILLRRPAVSNGVRHQVRHDLFDPPRVERELGRVRAQSHLHLETTLFEPRHQRLERRLAPRRIA